MSGSITYQKRETTVDMNKVDLYEPTQTGFICHSKSGQHYTLVYQPALVCNCPGYTYRGSCRHVDNAPINPTIQEYQDLPRPHSKEPNYEWINNMAYRLTHVVHA